MAEYTPLMATSPEESLDGELESKERTLKAHSLRYPLLFSILIAALAIFAAGAFHLSVSTTTIPLLTPKEVSATFQGVLPSPNLEKGKDYMHQLNLQQPVMTFPMYMTRVNAASPDTLYTSGSSIVLSPTDSMIYHWTINSRWQKCYVTGYVSAYDELLAAGKTYYRSEGDITSIEVWNLTPRKIQTLKTLSWNTRPERVSLLGTVNFTTVDVQRKVLELDGQELRAPTPRFDCIGDLQLTIEIVCTTCSLQFEQVFSSPPLGFELMQLG
ncbi:hypothetical protein DFH06DRAFT_169895 [Mycena polygramma]|nr:hypothetical protein DFH06DRAFT_169895 [Mycena polygramma]